MSREAAKERAEELAERVSYLGPLAIKPMFSGAAIMAAGAMVAFVIRGTVYLRVDEATAAAFEARGVPAFAYERATGTRIVRNYYAAPDDVLEDDEALREVMTNGLRTALAAKAPGHRPTGAPTRRRPRRD